MNKNLIIKKKYFKRKLLDLKKDLKIKVII